MGELVMKLLSLRTFFVFSMLLSGVDFCHTKSADRNLSELIEQNLGAQAAPVSSHIITVDGYILPRSGIEAIEKAVTGVLTNEHRVSGLYAMLAKSAGRGNNEADKAVAELLVSAIDVRKAANVFGVVPAAVRNAMTWAVVYAASQCGAGTQRSTVSNIEKKIEEMAKRSGSNIQVLNARAGF
jgi:hypothetical protein